MLTLYYCHKLINHFKRVFFYHWHEYRLGMVRHWLPLCHKTVVFWSALKQTLCNIIIRCTLLHMHRPQSQYGYCR
jgi:hypothetical protein